MQKQSTPIKVKYETLVIIWAALLMSQLLFLLVVFVAKPELFRLDLAQPLLGDEPLVVLVFAAMAIVLLLLSFVLRNQHLRRAVKDQDASCVQTGLLLGCALSEGCSLLGLILALAFDYQYFFLWIALGLLGILFHFPRRENLLAANYKEMR
jgi:hypothetical protein